MGNMLGNVEKRKVGTVFSYKITTIFLKVARFIPVKGRNSSSWNPFNISYLMAKIFYHVYHITYFN